MTADPRATREAVALAWLASAADDLALVKKGRSDPEIPAAGHRIPRAAARGKMLEGLLTTYSVEPEERHSISRLVAQLRLHDRAIADEIAKASHLTDFAVLLRYPPRLGSTRAISRADGLNAADLALDAHAVLDAAITVRTTSRGSADSQP